MQPTGAEQRRFIGSICKLQSTPLKPSGFGCGGATRGLSVCLAVFITAARRNGSDTRRLSPDTSVCTAASSPASPPWCHFCPTQPGHALLDAPSHTMSENYGSHGQHTRLMYASDPSAFQTVSRMAFTAPSGMQRGKLPATLTREYSYEMHCTHAQQVQTSHRH